MASSNCAARQLDGVMSFLFVPGNNVRLLESALRRQPRAVILDLEDAVPVTEKEVAREQLATALTALANAGILACVRVNRPWTIMVADLTAAVCHGATVIMVPKVAVGSDIEVVSQILDELDPIGQVVIVSQIESAKGIIGLGDIARARHDRHAALMLGPEDLALDLGVFSEPVTMAPYAQSLVTAAKAEGLKALGSPGSIAIIDDLSAYAVQLQAAKRMGFDGAVAIHPAQLPIIDDAFRPTAAELESARKIIDEDTLNGGRPFLLNGRMIDAPIVARARAILRGVAAGA